MATNLSPELRKRYFDANGEPLAGGFLYTYQAGTTTPQATYTDNTGDPGSENDNPIELDADGYADVWLDPTLSYKFALHDSDDVPIWTVDNVVGTLTNDSVVTATIQDDAVTSPKIADGAITQAKLAAQVLGPDSIQNYSLLASVAANELTITLRDGTGAAPSASSPVKIPFRNSTAATGTPVFRDVTSAITATISSGSTLGSVNAKANWVYVYALDNGGTVELAFSASKSWDEGSLQTTTAEGGAGTADSKTVLYANNARASKAIRLIGRIKSTQATAGTWATAPSEISLFPFEQSIPKSEVWCSGNNGYGATNIYVRRFIQPSVVSVGSDINVNDDAADGTSFTAQVDGIYAITYSDADSAGALRGAIMLNVGGTDGTAPVQNIVTTTNILAFGSTSTANANLCVSWTGFLRAGDYVWCQTDLVSAESNAPNYTNFRMARLS